MCLFSHLIPNRYTHKNPQDSPLSSSEETKSMENIIGKHDHLLYLPFTLSLPQIYPVKNKNRKNIQARIYVQDTHVQITKFEHTIILSVRN